MTAAAAHQQPLPAPSRKPGARPKRKKSVRHTIAGARSMIAKVGLRICTEIADPDADPNSDASFDLLADLADLHLVIAEQEALLVRAMRSHPHNYSWAEIGSLCGITGEAARKRWRHLDTVGARQPGGQPGRLR